MTPAHLAELQAAWPGEWKSESWSPQTRWIRLHGDVFIASATTSGGEEYRTISNNNTNWFATGTTFAECVVKVKRLLRDNARTMRRRAEDLERLTEDMP